MSSLALMEVQRALYVELAADGVLMGMLTGVYDAVPPQTVFPYLVIGDGTATIRAADAVTVTDCRLQLHVWSAPSGRKTVLAILNRLHALLHLGTLPLDGLQLVSLRTDQATVMLADQGVDMHGMLTILVTVAEE